MIFLFQNSAEYDIIYDVPTGHKMISTVTDYQHVVGADIDGDHPHGDLDRIIIDGNIMPRRDGYDRSGEPNHSYEARGEDLAFLMERSAEFLRSCDGFHYTLLGVEDVTDGSGHRSNVTYSHSVVDASLGTFKTGQFRTFGGDAVTYPPVFSRLSSLDNKSSSVSLGMTHYAVHSPDPDPSVVSEDDCIVNAVTELPASLYYEQPGSVTSFGWKDVFDRPELEEREHLISMTMRREDLKIPFEYSKQFRYALLEHALEMRAVTNTNCAPGSHTGLKIEFLDGNSSQLSTTQLQFESDYMFLTSGIPGYTHWTVPEIDYVAKVSAERLSSCSLWFEGVLNVSDLSVDSYGVENYNFSASKKLVFKVKDGTTASDGSIEISMSESEWKNLLVDITHRTRPSFSFTVQHPDSHDEVEGQGGSVVSRTIYGQESHLARISGRFFVVGKVNYKADNIPDDEE